MVNIYRFFKPPPLKKKRPYNFGVREANYILHVIQFKNPHAQKLFSQVKMYPKVIIIFQNCFFLKKKQISLKCFAVISSVLNLIMIGKEQFTDTEDQLTIILGINSSLLSNEHFNCSYRRWFLKQKFFVPMRNSRKKRQNKKLLSQTCSTFHFVWPAVFFLIRFLMYSPAFL